MQLPSRPLLLPLLGLLAATALANDDKPAAGPTTAPIAPAAEPVLELPKVQVTTKRVRQIDKEIKRVDKLIERERAKVKSTDLDRALNNEKVARAAMIFGGNSSEHLSAVAASRVYLLEQERAVLEAMKRPATAAEFKMMEAELEQLRVTRRNLDDAAKQR